MRQKEVSCVVLRKPRSTWVKKSTWSPLENTTNEGLRKMRRETCTSETLIEAILID